LQKQKSHLPLIQINLRLWLSAYDVIEKRQLSVN
jgi:hypothetical protein